MDEGYYDNLIYANPEWNYGDETDEEFDYPDTPQTSDEECDDESFDFSSIGYGYDINDEEECEQFHCDDQRSALKKRLECVELNPGPMNEGSGDDDLSCLVCGGTSDHEPGSKECKKITWAKMIKNGDVSLNSTSSPTIRTCRSCGSSEQGHVRGSPACLVKQINIPPTFCHACGMSGHTPGSPACGEKEICPKCLGQGGHDADGDECLENFRTYLNVWYASQLYPTEARGKFEVILSKKNVREMQSAWREFRNGVTPIELPSPPTDDPKQKTQAELNMTCRICKAKGHTYRACPKIQCHKCGKFGHVAKGCTDKQWKAKGMNSAHKIDLILKAELNRQNAADKGDEDAQREIDEDEREEELHKRLIEELGKTTFSAQDAELFNRIKNMRGPSDSKLPAKISQSDEDEEEDGNGGDEENGLDDGEPDDEDFELVQKRETMRNLTIKWTSPAPIVGLENWRVWAYTAAIGAVHGLARSFSNVKTCRYEIPMDALRSGYQAARSVITGSQWRFWEACQEAFGSAVKHIGCDVEDLLEVVGPVPQQAPQEAAIQFSVKYIGLPSPWQCVKSIGTYACIGAAIGLGVTVAHMYYRAWSEQKTASWFGKPVEVRHKIKFHSWIKDPLAKMPDRRPIQHARGELVELNAATAQLKYTRKINKKLLSKAKFPCYLELLAQTATFANTCPFTTETVKANRMINTLSRIQAVNIDKMDSFQTSDPTTNVLFVAYALSQAKKQNMASTHAYELFQESGALGGSQ